ncbi:AAEL003312-PA [Aedes aegypti]|uniref:AAEL003312-PA n=1 Tax=Aedes aegypti TaxID=7159 RepID=Q17FV2_AEDAE|nr:AAEL003312-PA [Aedes aegypti]
MRLNALLEDVFQLHVEDQSAVRGDHRGASSGSVGQLVGHGQSSLASDLHSGHSQIPSLDDFSAAQGELEAGSLVGRIEHLVVLLQATFVVDGNLLAWLGFCATADFEVFHDQSTLEGACLSFLLLLAILLQFLGRSFAIFDAVLLGALLFHFGNLGFRLFVFGFVLLVIIIILILVFIIVIFIVVVTVRFSV